MNFWNNPKRRALCLLALAGLLLIATPLLILRERHRVADAPVVSPQPPAASKPTAPAKTPPAQRKDDASTALKTVLGFYTSFNGNEKSSYQSLSQNTKQMSAMAAMAFQLTANGSIQGTTPPQGMVLAKSQHVKTFAAVANQTDGAFDKKLAHTVLSNPTLRQTAVKNLVRLVQQNGYAGLNLDFEGMQAGDRANYTQLVSDLADALHKNGATLVISVTGKTADEPKSAWSGAFDYAALGRAADQIQLMTYDEHGTWSEAGAVASLPWVQQVLQYATSQIPPQKILIGLPAYGYDWNLSNKKGNKAVAWKGLQHLIDSTGATAQWDAKAESPYFYYQGQDGSQHVVWYENAKSVAAKVGLVRKWNLGGLSVWRMGLEDASFWRDVQASLAQSSRS